MDRFNNPTPGGRALPGSGPGRGVRVSLAWRRSCPAPADEGTSPLTPTTATAEYWSRRRLTTTALAPSPRHASATAEPLDDDFDPRRLVQHPVTVLDLGRGGLHLTTRVRPPRDRDHWIGIEEDGAVLWSKVVLRCVSEPIAGAYLARYSFAGACPYELIRRAILGRPPAPKREREPGCA